MRVTLRPLLVAALSAAAVASSHAGPVEGTSAAALLTATAIPNPPLINTSATVGAGVEFSFAGGGSAFVRADLSDAGVTLSFVRGTLALIGTDLIWQFTLDPLLVIGGITEISDTFTNGSTLVSFSNNVATFRISDQSFSSTSPATFSAVYNWTVRQTTTVPEPGTIALAGAALLALGASRRRLQG